MTLTMACQWVRMHSICALELAHTGSMKPSFIKSITPVFRLLWRVKMCAVTNAHGMNEVKEWSLSFSQTGSQCCNCWLVFPPGTSALRLCSVTVSLSGCSSGLGAALWGLATTRCVCFPPTSTDWSFATCVNSSSDAVRTCHNAVRLT